MRVSNENITEMTHIKRIRDEIRRRRWNWIGNILRGERSSDCMVALGWRPEGKRPKTTWIRTVDIERGQAAWNDWSTARAVARGKLAWKKKIATLCAY